MPRDRDELRSVKGERLEGKLRLVERRDRILEKDHSEERAVFEEVFDRFTLMTVYELMNKGEIEDISGVLKSGKESRIYLGRAPDGRRLAIKIYLTVSSEFRKGMLPYIMGDPRFKNVRKDSRHLVYAWAQKEYKNLSAAHDAGVRVPRPITVKNNILLMEFIGSEEGNAPLMKEIEMKNPARVFQKILADVKRLYRKARLVHGDLSEYNIMIWKGQPIIFDLSQSVPLEHPNSREFLLRDLENLHQYFKKLDVDVPTVQEMSRRVTGERA